MEGIWHQEIKIGDEVFWNLKTQLPHKIVYETHPLPSDSNFREDILAWRMNDQKLAQQETERLD